VSLPGFSLNLVQVDDRHHPFSVLVYTIPFLRAPSWLKARRARLAIAEKAVEEHGGRGWVESTVDQGSAFRFLLPKNVEGLVANP
jgi:hypothetical protein